MSFTLLGILNSQAAGAGGGAAYDHLATTTTSASSVTFSGLGSYSDYKHLQIRFVTALSTNIGDDNYNIWIQLNNDTGSTNYRNHYLYGNGSSVVSQDSNATEAIQLNDLVPSSSKTNQYGAGVIDLLDFANSSKNTTLRVLGGAAGGAGERVVLGSGLWLNTNAVTSIKLFTPAFGFSSSRFSLYGIKG